MKVVYADVYFALNFCADLAILLCTAQICGRVASLRRAIASSALGGAYAVGCEILTVLQNPVFILLCTSVMCFVSFGKSRDYLKIFAVFILSGACLGGCVWALTLRGMANTSAFALSLLVFSLGVLVSVLFKNTAKTQKGGIRHVRISLLGKTSVFSAVTDTGNQLCDPVSGEDAVIIAPDKLTELLPRELSRKIAHLSPAEALTFLSGTIYAPRFRLLSYRTLSGSGLMLAFRADELWIDNKKRAGTLIAVSTTKLDIGAHSALV